MIILSIDIGIKNLAFAILEDKKEVLNKSSTNVNVSNLPNTSFKIVKWGIINLCNHIPNCKTCNKPAKYSKNSIFYCKQHTKVSEYKIPNINTKNLTKQNMKKLQDIASEYELPHEKTMNKRVLLDLIEDHLNNICFDIID